MVQEGKIGNSLKIPKCRQGAFQIKVIIKQMACIRKYCYQYIIHNMYVT